MQFTIPHNTIKALLLSAGKNDIRHYLNGICLDVTADAAVLVATQGYFLVALPVAIEDKVTGSYIIPRSILDGFKPGKKLDVTVTVEPVAKIVTLTDGSASMSSKLEDGRYPDWRRIVPTRCSMEVSQFNCEYVGTFHKINALLGSSCSPAIVHNGSDAARIILTGNAIGVLMPMRREELTVDTPNWARAS